MAIFRKNKLRGLIGGVISKAHLNKDVLQSRPKKYKNTIPSQISACEGAIASSSGKVLRKLFLPLHCNFDRMAHSRLFAALKKSIFESRTASAGQRDLHDGDLSFIRGFQLNSFSPLDKIMKIRPAAELLPDGRLRLSFDSINAEKDIKNPSQYSAIILRFLCFAVNFPQEQQRYLECKDFIVPKAGKLEGQEHFIDCNVPNGSLIFLICSLHWQQRFDITEGQIVNTKEFSPAEIIGVWKADVNEDFGFSNTDIPLAQYHWNSLVEYKGNDQLQKAAKLLKKMPPGLKKTSTEKAEPELFPFRITSGEG